MGRFDGDGDDYLGYAEQCLWEQAQWNALHSKRGRSVLEELEAALLAMPEHRLAEGSIVTAEGLTCALGELAVYRQVKSGEDRPTALETLWEEYPGDEIAADGEEDSYTEDLGRGLGLTNALTVQVAYINDELWATTPEERWTRMLDWVRNALDEPRLTRRARA
jgi:hypothetical protein